MSRSNIELQRLAIMGSDSYRFAKRMSWIPRRYAENEKPQKYSPSTEEELREFDDILNEEIDKES